MRVTLKARKFVLFFAIFAVWLFLDLATKGWADTTLANRGHPIPFTVTPEEDGKPLAEVAAARFGWSDAETAERIGALELLEPAVAYQPGDRPYDETGPAATARGFYVFWRGDTSLPPRRLDKHERALVGRWLALTFPDADKAKLQEAASRVVSEMTFSEWLPWRFRKLDTSDAERLVADRLHPITGQGAFPNAAEPVAAGQTWLLTSNRIDVMGDWFKFVYAENPNAAFGFLKGVDPDTRATLFTLLTLFALAAILYIVFRLPPVGWFVYSGFAAILGGAVGNFVDRVRYGYVIDFIDMDLGFMHWPTYNVADIGIAVGVISLILNITLDRDSPLVSKEDKERREAKRQAKLAKKKARAA